jgi:hypothetical protein
VQKAVLAASPDWPALDTVLSWPILSFPNLFGLRFGLFADRLKTLD